MIIKTLKLKNFGRHSEFNISSECSVIGLLGPNGAGKSTILEALEFAITGETKEILSSYVKNGEGNASVEITFQKNGRQGKIYRQFGKSPKRILTWDNREIKAAKECDAILAEIFGSDKKALSNAIFVKQGVLEAILFDDNADRKRTFIKLVNLAFCAKRAELLDKKVKQLESGMVDLGPAIDMAEKNRELALNEYETRRLEANAMPGRDEEIRFCARQIAARETQNRVSAEISAIEIQIESDKANVKNCLAKAGIENGALEDLKVICDQHAQEVSKQETAVSRCQAILADFGHWDSLETDIKNLRTRIAKLNEEFEALHPGDKTIEQLQLEVKRLEQCRKDKSNLNTWNEELNLKSGIKTTLIKRLSELIPAKYNKEEIDQLVQERTNLEIEINILKIQLTALNEIRECVRTGQIKNGVCPKCGVHVSNMAELSDSAFIKTIEEIIEKLGQRLEALHTKIKTAASQLSDFERAHFRASSDLSALEKEIAVVEKNVAVLVAKGVSKEDLNSLDIEIRRIDKIITGIPFITRQMQQATRELDIKLEAKETHVLARENINYRHIFNAQTLFNLENKLTEQKKINRDYSELYNAVNILITTLENKKTTITRLAYELQNAQALLHEKLSSNIDVSNIEQDDNFYFKLKAVCEEDNRKRAEAFGRMNQADDAYQSLNTQYHDLKKRAASNEEKQKLINDLKKLKDLLMDDGLPMAYVRYKFEQLAVFTQEALVKLNANFAIQIDRAKDLTFNFIRLDDDTQFEMPMNKLSGGQKVRLCVAFLLAMQKCLVSEIGLLVADELSMHLDTEGVESMAEFIRNLRNDLQGNEMQIWVVDHALAMENSFEKVIRLNN